MKQKAKEISKFMKRSPITEITLKNFSVIGIL